MLPPMTTAARAALSAGLVAVILVVVKLSLHGFDPSFFVMTGDVYCDARATPPSLTVPTKDQGGYDGQFYYRLALDPFDAEVTAHGITLDNPPYRHQRILNSFVAWALSAGGDPARVPWVLIGLNVAGLSALAWLVARLTGGAWWGIAVALYPGFLFALSRNLLEITSSALMVAGLLFARRARWWPASAAFFLAVMVRETTLIVPATLAAVQAATWLGPRARALTGSARATIAAVLASAAPILGFLIWQAVLTAAWGRVPALSGGGTLSAPFVGFARFLVDAVARLYVLDLLQAALLVATVVLVARVLRRAPVPSWEKVSFVLYALLAACLSDTLCWVDPASYLRVTGELFVLGTLVLVSAGRPPRPLYAAWGALSIFYACVTSDLVRP